MPFVGDDHPLLRQIGDATWMVTEPLTYRAKVDRYTVEKNFETDLASVPRPLVWLIPRYGRYTKCAILHDWLWRRTPVHKADANGIFRRSMREEDVSLVHRWMMWAAVGLASTIKHPRSIRRRDIPHILGLLAVGLPSAAFVGIPFVIVALWIALFYIVDGVGYLVEFVTAAFRGSDQQEVNAPSLGWRLS